MRFLGDITNHLAKKLYSFMEDKINSEIFQDNTLNFDIVGLDDFKNRTFYVDLKGPIDKLREIKKILENELVEKYRFKPDRRFKGHITIGRLKRNRRRDKGVKFNRNKYNNLKSDYKEKKLGEVVFKKLYLKKSTLTSKGPIYENLHF
ncbi:MAG: hypothetical protein GF364_01365 [Candidatus Lokiarchaeota archaeon]|nr:hypothetical protein [Candidatus Lokiarchaeota archaeon]